MINNFRHLVDTLILLNLNIHSLTLLRKLYTYFEMKEKEKKTTIGYFTVNE